IMVARRTRIELPRPRRTIWASVWTDSSGWPQAWLGGDRSPSLIQGSPTGTRLPAGRAFAYRGLVSRATWASSWRVCWSRVARFSVAWRA
ncbi:MAG: hypothetical protein QOG20_2070, partial [Pseudonocardiales bacterium]|nr:hypothetical protein [Pseudonocardiales bacterium]